jgi:hypothetical protein
MDGPAPCGSRTDVPSLLGVRAHNPAGFLTLNGCFLADHQQEIHNLACNEEATEKVEYLLHRIIDIRARTDGILITTNAEYYVQQFLPG